MLLQWAFGAGAQGITPVGTVDGQYIEHRVSWYRRPSAGALTLGHPARPSRNVQAALGVAQSETEITRCFQCHATNVLPGPDLSAMTPGVQCERCHGAAGSHAKDPARFPLRAPRGRDGLAICAGCHRSIAPSAQSDAPEVDDPLSIRFQPIGLMASRCFKLSGSLTCTTCHDPHENARPAAVYTAVCLGCHKSATAGRTCQRASGRACVVCHMQAASPVPHLRFTDHRVRIY